VLQMRELAGICCSPSGPHGRLGDPPHSLQASVAGDTFAGTAEAKGESLIMGPD